MDAVTETALDRANRRIAELEKMLETFQCLDPVDSLAGAEIKRLRYDLAMANAKLAEYTAKGSLRNTAAAVIHHIDGNKRNNRPDNIEILIDRYGAASRIVGNTGRKFIMEDITGEAWVWK